MGAIAANYLLIGLFIAIGVIQLCQSLRASLANAHMARCESCLC